jgi:hypothetical protein
MNRVSRILASIVPRLVAAALFVYLLVDLQFTRFPPFFLGAVPAVVVGFFVRARYRTWAGPSDALCTYFALSLAPLGMWFLLARPPWFLLTAMMAAATGLIVYRVRRTKVLPFVAALWVLSICASLGMVDMLRSSHRRPPNDWPGTSIRLNDAGWDDAVETSVIEVFPARYKMPTLPEPIVPGDPPTSRVLGVIQRNGNWYSLRPTAENGWVELHPTQVALPGCAPLVDVGFYRLNRQWLFLCAGSERVEIYNSRDGRSSGALGHIGPYPRRLAVHQENDRLFVVSPAYGQLVEFDLETGDLLRKVFVGLGAADVVVSPDGRRLYVAVPYRGRVQVLDATTLRIVDHVPAPFGVASLTTDRLNNRVYGAVLPTGRLIVIDPQSNLVIQRVELGGPTLDLAYEEATAKIYWVTPYGMRWAFLPELLK